MGVGRWDGRGEREVTCEGSERGAAEGGAGGVADGVAPWRVAVPLAEAAEAGWLSPTPVSGVA